MGRSVAILYTSNIQDFTTPNNNNNNNNNNNIIVLYVDYPNTETLLRSEGSWEDKF